MSEAKTVQIQEWIHEGYMIIRADALEPEHPMHPYNQLLAQGVKPEDYGIEEPFADRFRRYTRSQLIRRIVELENELIGRDRWG
jgi:hypothetical protein